MAQLRTLQSRIKTLNTRRVNILKGEQRRVSGSARFPSSVISGSGTPGSTVSVVVWLTSVTVNLITELHFSSVVVMRRRISGRSVPNAIDKSLLVKRRVVCRTRRCRRCPEVVAERTTSSDCNPTRGGIIRRKKRSLWTPRPLSRREKIPVSGQLTC